MAEEAEGTTNDDQDPKKGTEAPLHKITVNGEEQEVTMEKLLEMAQKGEAADEKFREAADARQFRDDFDALKNNDEGAFRRVAKHLKWTEEQVGQALKMHKQAEIRSAIGMEDGADEGTEGGEEDPTPTRAREQIDKAALAKEVAAILGPVLQQNLKVTAQNLDPRLQKLMGALYEDGVKKNLDSELDSDEFYGKILGESGSSISEEVRLMLKEETDRRAASGDDLLQPKVRQAILQTVKSRLKRLKIDPLKPVPSTGLGSAGAGMQSLHQSKTPLERPEGGMASPDYDDYFDDMLARLSAERGS